MGVDILSVHLKPPTTESAKLFSNKHEASPLKEYFRNGTLSIPVDGRAKDKLQLFSANKAQNLFFFLIFAYRWDRRHWLQQQPVGLRWSLVSSVAEVRRLGGQRSRFKVHIAIDFKLCRKNCCCIGKEGQPILPLFFRSELFTTRMHSPAFNYSTGQQSGWMTAQSFINFRSIIHVHYVSINPTEK